MPVKFQVKVSVIKLFTKMLESLKETLITSYDNLASDVNIAGLECD